MKEDVVVNPGDIITFQTSEDILNKRTCLHELRKNFQRDVKPGKILLDDGKLMFEAIETNGQTSNL
jgi:pyruvate kinase